MVSISNCVYIRNRNFHMMNVIYKIWNKYCVHTYILITMQYSSTTWCKKESSQKAKRNFCVLYNLDKCVVYSFVHLEKLNSFIE